MGDTGQCPRLDAKLYTVILEKCLAFLGLPNTYSFIGGRACGMAYLSGDKVYKITTDKSEAIESKKVVGKNNNHLVNIYSVKKVNTNLTNTEVYLIIMEHLRTNRSAIFKDIETELMNLFDEHLGITLFDLIHQYRFQPAYYKNQHEESINVILDEYQREKHYYNSLLQIVNELKTNGIESIDVQYHNLGLKPSGNIAFFDMGMGNLKGQVSSIQVQEEFPLDEEIKDLMSVMKQDGITIEQLATKLSQRLGFGQAKILGKGTQGFAVDVGNNTVMKITTDESEATETAKLIGKQAKYLGNVFKVYRMNQPYQKSFVILRELLRVDENENKVRFQTLTDVMRDHGISIHDYTTSFDGIVMKGDRIKLKQYAELIGQIPPEQFKIVNDFFNIFNELIDFGIKSADFTGSNFGFKPNGVYAYYDLGYSDNNSADDLEVIDLNERITSYMKNSSAVGVKKKCQINGNGDGTSTACNQGDIKNIELSKIDEGQDVKIEYGALMLYFDIKKWKEITSIIEEDDIYDEPTFGVETEPHVTILYGFHKEVTSKQIEDLLKEKHNPTENIEIELVGISHFETPKYDVVKFDAKSNKLTELNKLVKKLPFTSDYPDYHPHMTISYVKKGKGKKYEEKFDELIKLKSNNIVYSTVDSVKTTINEHTGQWNKRLQRKEKMLAEDIKISLNDLPFKTDIEQAGGKLYSVGGAVRDTILGRDSKDLDILVTGLPLDQLETILAKYGRVDNVGKSFGIIKFNSPKTGEIDIAIPRTERKNDQGGYQGFDVTSDHNLPIEKDLERRDFTINAIAKDSSGLMIDPYGGQGDIAKKQIKMVNPQAFSDDPLRMLRAVQFAARFGFNIEPETMTAIQQNAAKIKEISPERILIEFDKIVKKGDQMVGAKLLRQTGLYNYIFGINRGINLADFKYSKTMGEFIFALIGNAIKNPAEFYKTNMKGDLDTYNELRAIEIGWNFNGERKKIFDMFKIYPKSIETGFLGPKFTEAVQYMKSHNIPFSLKDVPVNGNDLMQLGFQGKQIGDAFVNVLNKLYTEELSNDREAILNYVQTLKGQ